MAPVTDSTTHIDEQISNKFDRQPYKPPVHSGFPRPNQDFTCLSEEAQQRYLQLCMEGTPESVAVAAQMFPEAARDAAEIRRCRNLLDQYRQTVDGEAKTIDAIEAADVVLDDLDDQISELMLKREKLENRITELKTKLPHRHAKRPVEMACQRVAVRLALAEELEDAGII